mgnify:CR=1 FL=1
MYLLQMVLAYIIMLIAMTFNFFLFLACIVGMVAGFAVFGFINVKKIALETSTKKNLQQEFLKEQVV